MKSMGLVVVVSGLCALSTEAPPLVRQSQESPPFEVTGAAFFAIQVPSVMDAAGWYATTLGLEEVHSADAPDGRYRIRILARDGLTVELIEARDVPRPSVTPTHGLFKAGFYVGDVGTAYGWLRDLGVDVDEQVFTDPVLEARSFVFRDPYGNRLQVFERTQSGR